jgi:CHASE2 domain-containing sensor protein
MLNNFYLKKIIVGIIASVTVSSFIIGLRHQGSFEQIELLAYDFLVRLDAKSGSDERITIVGIDDNTLRKLNSDKISDGTLKQVLETIEQYQPRVIGVDIIRDIPIGEGREELLNYVNNLYQPLEAAIKPIIFPCALPSENKPNGIEPPPVIDPDSAIGFVDLDTDPQNIFGGELIRRASISSIPVNIGLENAPESQFDSESNISLCNVPFSFSFLIALSYLQAQQEEVTPDLIPNIEEIIDLTKITEGEIRVKSSTFSTLKPKTGSYRNLDPRVYQHLIDYYYTEPGEIISLTKVIEKQITPAQFKDKVVLIGYTTKEDIHQTPLGIRPGVFVHGWIVSQLLRNVLDEQPSIWTWSEPVQWLWIMVWGLAGSILALGIRSVGIFVLSQGIAIAILWGSCWFLFTQQGWIPLIPPFFSLAISSIIVKAISSKFSQQNISSDSQSIPPLIDDSSSINITSVETNPSSSSSETVTYVEGFPTNSPPSSSGSETYVEGFPTNSPPSSSGSETYVEGFPTNPPPSSSESVTYVEGFPTNPPPSSSGSETYVEGFPTNSSQPKPTKVEPNHRPVKKDTFIRQDPFIEKSIGDGDRYFLQQLLGQGGMSKVYLALDKRLNNKKVAIKIMTSYFLSNNQYLIKRFMGEVQSLCILNHPNIIQITDYGLTPKESPFSGYPFYVMEYFVGQTLQQLLENNPTISLDLALRIILKVCHGLKEAHNKGIIHRDLKPDNIFLISGDTLGEVVKILDFGIAKKIDEESNQHTQLTVAGTFIGTYRYASPEQCRGANIDSRTDIYSLGVVLYELISNNNPYNIKDDSNTTKADWIASHLRESPKPLREQPSCENLSVELNNIVMKCLEKSPQSRFQTIEELEQALRKCL